MNLKFKRYLSVTFVLLWYLTTVNYIMPFFVVPRLGNDELTLSVVGMLIGMTFPLFFVLFFKKQGDDDLFPVQIFDKSKKIKYIYVFVAIVILSISAVYLNELFLLIGHIQNKTVLPQSNNVEVKRIILYSCLLVPINEELLYRILIYETQREINNDFVILFSALLFASGHDGTAAFIGAFMIGMIFMKCYCCSHAVGPIVLLHALYNLVQCCIGRGIILPFSYVQIISMKFTTNTLLALIFILLGFIIFLWSIVLWLLKAGGIMAGHDGNVSRGKKYSPWLIVVTVVMYMNHLFTVFCGS